MDHREERADLAAAFRWAARNNWHEAIANHFSLAVSDDGKKFLINPNGRHFARIRASDLLLCDATDSETLNRPDAPDATAWGQHGSVHRNIPWARCALHLHSKYATVLASLADSSIPPIDQNTAMFYGRTVVDDGFSGLAFEDEGERVCGLLTGRQKRTLVMGNHGVMVIGETVAEAWNTLYYFERACETYITALATGRELRVLSHNIAMKTAEQMNTYSDVIDNHLGELRAILDAEGSDYAA
ncbi:MAG: class II aldolase and adducin N-terminal domain-containing protein [Paracoccaceae bacterium]